MAVYPLDLEVLFMSFTEGQYSSNIKLYLEYISFFQDDVLKLWRSGFLFVAYCKVEFKLNCFNLKQST